MEVALRSRGRDIDSAIGERSHLISADVESATEKGGDVVGAHGRMTRRKDFEDEPCVTLAGLRVTLDVLG